MGYSFFSPYQDCEAAVVARINASNSLLAAMIWKYESGAIHNAILAAQARYGLVYLIFDRRQQFLQDVRLQQLQDAGAVVLIDKTCRQVRSQYIIIDDYWVLTGAYIYTHTFDAHYASNLLTLAYYVEYDAHLTDFVYHMDHSELFA